MMEYIDSHCHLDIEPLAKEKEAAIERAAKAGVTRIINVGTSIRGSRASVDLANLYPNIWASVGLHPHDAGTILDLESTTEELRLMAQNDKVVAIGEIGLDFFDFETRAEVSPEIKAEQIRLFEAQLGLAAELKKPVILHIRDAWDEALRLLNTKYQGPNTKLIGVVHCFTGTPEIAQKFLDLGFYIGFTGFITFEQAKFDQIRQSVQSVPISRILTETDAPFLAPEPHRGKTNEPAFVAEVTQKIAELKQISVTEVSDSVKANTASLFSLK